MVWTFIYMDFYMPLILLCKIGGIVLFTLKVISIVELDVYEKGERKLGLRIHSRRLREHKVRSNQHFHNNSLRCTQKPTMISIVES